MNDAAWRELDAAFREWAQAPTGPRYRAFLDADRRWRGMTERTRPARDAEGAGERRPVLAAN